MLPATLPNCESDLGGVLGFHKPDIHVNVSNILDEDTSRTLNGDDASLNGNLNTLGDNKFFCRVNVPHLLYRVNQRANIAARDVRTVDCLERS